MSEPTPTSPETPAPPQLEKRTCRKCNETKVVVPETWVYRKGRTGRYQAEGNLCLECDKQRKADYDAKRKQIAAFAADVPATRQSADTSGKDKQREAVAQTKLDIARALKLGSHTLNEYAPSVLAKLLERFEDDTHPDHQWAVQFFAERIFPRKLYEELGGTAAGGSLADKRPQYVIQILPAQPNAPEGRIVDGQAQVVNISPSEPE
jgi:hypothetical protein